MHRKRDRFCINLGVACGYLNNILIPKQRADPGYTDKSFQQSPHVERLTESSYTTVHTQTG